MQKQREFFWVGEHISIQMLKAHLDPDFEGASRKLDLIDKCVAWIKNKVQASCTPVCLILAVVPDYTLKGL